MKAFRFTLEAVRTVRQRQEQQALEEYARALCAREKALQTLAAIDHRIGSDYVQMRQLLSGKCTAAQAAQAQSFQRTLQKKREEGVAALGQCERRVNAASKTMLAARQQREMVDVFRDKQQAVHQRLELREEQKLLDEFAIRRVTAHNSIHTHSDHD
jgi:flagellar export protein FliJ